VNTTGVGDSSCGPDHPNPTATTIGAPDEPVNAPPRAVLVDVPLDARAIGDATDDLRERHVAMERDARRLRDAVERRQPRAVGKPDGTDRRTFSVASTAMAAGLAAGYGMMGYVAFQFLKPQGRTKRGWMFVKPVKEFEVGGSLRFRAPDGSTINITRAGNTGTAEDFTALSSVCPHLGCQVHWEQKNNRYFCPCHNGTFDPQGKATGGPPAAAGQSLGTYELRVEAGLLYIEVPIERLAHAGSRCEQLEDDGSPRGPGHDPCLAPRDQQGRPV